MIEKDEKLILAGWILASKYRKRVMITIGTKLKTPSVISRESDIKMNYISNVLKELKEKKLVECINETAKKGRLYQVTELGEEIMRITKKIEV